MGLISRVSSRTYRNFSSMPSNLPKFCRPKRRKLHLTAGERNRIQSKRQQKIAKMKELGRKPGIKYSTDSSEENSRTVPLYKNPPNNNKDCNPSNPDTDELSKEICTPKTKKIPRTYKSKSYLHRTRSRTQRLPLRGHKRTIQKCHL